MSTAARRGAGVFPIARILGIPIYVHYTWFIIFGVISWTLAEGYYPSLQPDLPVPSYWAKGMVSALLLFASVIFHELGHSLVAMRNGIGIVSITLFIFGGVARLREDPRSAWVEFKVAIAGPVASFILAGLFHLAGRSGLPGATVTSYLAFLNLSVGVFNLIPAFPLDGGRVLRAALWSFTGKGRATRISTGLGTLFAYLLILSGIGVMVGLRDARGLWFVLLGWFLKDAAAAAYQQVRVDELLFGVRVRDLMVDRSVSVPAAASLEQAVQDYFLRYGYGGFPVDDGTRIRGLVSLSEVKNVPPEEWARTSVQAILTPVDEHNTIGPDQDAFEALVKMASSGQGRLLVVDAAGGCVGLITHNGILRRLKLQEQLGA